MVSRHRWWLLPLLLMGLILVSMPAGAQTPYATPAPYSPSATGGGPGEVFFGETPTEQINAPGTTTEPPGTIREELPGTAKPPAGKPTLPAGPALPPGEETDWKLFGRDVFT